MRFHFRPRLLLWAVALPALLAGLFLAVRFSPFFSQKEDASASSEEEKAEEFFEDYWRTPIALQGLPPAHYTEKEASLRPEACGSCHPRQYADWKESLHSKAMGPGPWGQLLQMDQNSPDEAALCRSCHAPLSEQSPILTKAKDQSQTIHEKNPHFDSHLQLQGITCAACHVRRHQRFGPPKDESLASHYPPGTPNHGGVERTSHFERAAFCKGCHQLDPENSLLLNGKPLMDTYREWKNSLWGKGEASCQECHMPRRRHLWKGIHDREWVREGVRFDSRLTKPARRTADSLELAVELVNAAVGHKFPTYPTPKVFIRAALLDRSAKPIPGTTQERVIGWDARFENGQWKEYFDSRISPGDSYRETFRWSRPEAARAARAWVEVHPDHFYHVHFYPVFLKSEELSVQARALIEKALQESGRSAYTLFDQTLPLPSP